MAARDPWNAAAPPSDNSSAFDWCAWCHNWIPADTERVVTVIPLDRALLTGEPCLAEIPLENRTLLVLVTQETEGDHRNVAVIVLCSRRCDEKLAAAIGRDNARACGQVVPIPEATAEERREAEEMIAGVCAWCLNSVSENAQVRVVFGTLTGDEPRRPGMTAIEVAGRHVPGRIPEAGSEVALDGYDIGFMLCSLECEAALCKAIRSEVSLRVRA